MPIEELEYIIFDSECTNEHDDHQQQLRETIWNLQAINRSHKENK